MMKAGRPLGMLIALSDAKHLETARRRQAADNAHLAAAKALEIGGSPREIVDAAIAAYEATMEETTPCP